MNQLIKFATMYVIDNIVRIRKEKGISQENIAFAINCDATNWNKIENGKQQLKVSHLAKIAEILQVDILYLFTYPKTFVDESTIKNYEKISVTFEVSPDKRDILLNLVAKKKVEDLTRNYRITILQLLRNRI
jgi:transcriptional regulator with XRE-family HTH domain